MQPRHRHRARAVVIGTQLAIAGGRRQISDWLAGPDRPPDRWGVNVVGHVRHELGLGGAARAVIAGLDAQRVPLVPVEGPALPTHRAGVEIEAVAPHEAPFAINLLCLNGDAVRGFARGAGRQFFAERRSVGLWWWEAGSAPSDWRHAGRWLDEVWVASRHVAELVADVAPVPVRRVTMPVPPPLFEAADRVSLGLPEGFLFLTLFDYQSALARKNPLGAIAAFKAAFPKPSGPVLVVKSINDRHDRRGRRHLHEAVAGRPDVHLLEGYVGEERINGMLAACDVYVSLHRAEGFGLPIASAMALGKPVIATGFSGNMEYMDQGNSYPVDYALTSVGVGSWPYDPGAEWAEPNLEQAAELMRQVVVDRDEANARGGRAAADMARIHGPAAAGRTLLKGLEELDGEVREFEARSPGGARPVPRLRERAARRRRLGRERALAAASRMAEARRRRASKA